MQRFWARLNSQSGAFFGAVLLPVVSAVCLRLWALPFQLWEVPLPGWDNFGRDRYQMRIMLSSLIVAHFFVGAVFGGLTGSIINLIRLNRRDWARRCCLWAGGTLLLIQLTIFWFPSLKAMLLRRQLEPGLLFASIMFGMPALWTFGLLGYGLLRPKENQNTRRE
ncbi:MAG: hypothetical protein JWN98_2405 [Abditibacteriota bacterium]|nr:hypothetical protein [Abditibacteriota bacterium]